MLLSDIRDLYEYTYWATHRLLDSVANVPPEEYMRNRGSSHGGIHGTLVHALGAEEIWLKRWNGGSPTTIAKPDDYAGFAGVRARWQEVEAGITAFCRALKSDDDLRTIITYRQLNGKEFRQPLGHLMQHLVNHSTFHRGQATGMVRQAGIPPQSQDMVAFYREKYPS